MLPHVFLYTYAGYPIFNHTLLTIWFKKLSINRTWQHFNKGFQSRSNNQIALFDLVVVLQKLVDNKKTTGAVFIDLSKTFDTYSTFLSCYTVSIRKIVSCGTALMWFSCYISVGVCQLEKTEASTVYIRMPIIWFWC